MTSNLNSKDYYQILGVPRNADDAALKKAYKKLAVKWHPDKNPDNEEATKNFQKISEAYATLNDSKKRQMYDQYGEEGVKAADQMGDDAPHGFGGMPHGHGFHGGGGGPHMSATDAERIFEAFFGGSDPFGGGMRGGGGPGMRFSTGGGGGGMGHDPFGMMGGMGMGGMGGRPGSFSHPGFGGMPGVGGHPGFGGGGMSRQRKPQWDAIKNGTVVSLKGLVSRPERNGDRGEIQGYDPNSGRYIVVLEDTDEQMSVKPSNLLQHVHVRLHGLESRPELNGQQGTIIAWDQHKERYNIYVMSVSKVASLKSSNVILEEGTVGQITGLVAKPELNGRWGTIKKWDSESGRYDVQLSADKIMRVKMENVHV